MSHIKYHICIVFFKKDCRKIYEQKNVTLTLVITAKDVYQSWPTTEAEAFRRAYDAYPSTIFFREI